MEFLSEEKNKTPIESCSTLTGYTFKQRTFIFCNIELFVRQKKRTSIPIYKWCLLRRVHVTVEIDTSRKPLSTDANIYD